jgi:hypothetical protein
VGPGSVDPQPYLIVPVPSVETLSSLPKFSLADRATQLNKFEVLLLNPDQALEFNTFFDERKLDVPEPLFQAWLLLKNSSLPTEDQAINRVLSNHTASNVPKRKNKRTAAVPMGPARYNPSSPEWEEILHDQAAKKKYSGKENISSKRKAPANFVGTKSKKAKVV